MLYGDGPVKAYYFSSSCGSTTDENIWEKGDRDQTPYIKGRRVSDPASESDSDLTGEEEFSEFIRKKHGDDLEISEPWYRWNCYVPLEQIEQNVNTWAGVRAQHSKDGVLRQEDEGYIWQETDSIGNIQDRKSVV